MSETATYKGFAIVIQEDNKKEAVGGFDFNNVELIEKAIKKTLSINDYYYLIKHDRDIQEDGTPKRTHYHLVLDLQKKHSKTAYLEELSNALDFHKEAISIDPLISIEAQVRYLIHIDDPQKHQYNDFEIRTNDNKYQKYILGLEMWLIDTMKHCNNMAQFTDRVGLDLAQRYRAIAKDYISDLDKPTLEQLYHLKRLIQDIEITTTRHISDKEKVEIISDLIRR